MVGATPPVRAVPLVGRGYLVEADALLLQGDPDGLVPGAHPHLLVDVGQVALAVAAESNNSSPIRRLERHFDGDAVGGLRPQVAALRGLEQGADHPRLHPLREVQGYFGRCRIYIDANLARTLLLNGEV